MTHVSLVDITADEPAHRTAHHDVRSKVFLGGNSRSTHYAGQAIRGHCDNRFVLILMSDQRGNGPHLDCVSGGKGGASVKKFAGVFVVGTVPPHHLLQDAGDISESSNDSVPSTPISRALA